MNNKFGKKKKLSVEQFDREKFRAVIKCSICTGERVAGFTNIQTGEFHDIMLIKNDEDLKCFKEMYGVTEMTKEY